MRIHWIIAGACALSTACAYSPPAVPVAGRPADLSALAGSWIGEYWSDDTGRLGNITFELTAGADSAHGDVLMVPEPDRGGLPIREEATHQPPELLRIRFARVEGSRVRGSLAAYRDPACGCRIETVFEGVLRDDVIEGTFRSRHLETGIVHDGRWRAERAGSPSRAAAGDGP